MGPLMLDCAAYELSAQEREMLDHPLVGGVILFTRNYYDKAQLQALVKAIRQAARQPLLVAVDHEGGRVQRFRTGFTELPAMGAILPAVKQELATACELANACGQILAYELSELDIDMSFGPVLDIDGCSTVIGDRALAANAKAVIPLAGALIEGMQYQGMPVTGKHFPGHGSVVADSHVALPMDGRAFSEIEQTDMVVFKQLIEKLDAIMPAHVIYQQVDPQPAGFSEFWLQTVLRQQLQFDDVIFSDDLSMHGASVAGDYPQRAQQALQAGCDMVLACNNTAGAIDILDHLPHPASANRRLLAFNQRQRGVDARGLINVPLLRLIV
ncbi:beta-N-acetylhexosaminidase [Salinimonas marina]|uniref:Beta-hexosaminidase n=1 Tax=Salinimonas marina TaxID=2785918 RepID=A0A7S9DVD1_9ALTE|nr:beta-N-acetylhexosaminidase [Salinimonas marina]QPG04545.1 beta-N-acetylhexosaminidase [Salinimonas marina]